jgi:two-component system chemotaxis response regulator CheB
MHQKNRIYVAPPGRQLLLGLHTIALEQPLSKNRFRPTIDALFVSAANIFSLRVIGAVLSGNLGDGAQGLLAIKTAGGISIVQKTIDAEFNGMPESALHLHPADYVLPAADMGILLGTLVN